ncbi:hypothetical protein [Solilutibacter silvestris]|nr:hypothetical protein [Lysobacter silvestris]
MMICSAWMPDGAMREQACARIGNISVVQTEMGRGYRRLAAGPLWPA